MTTEKSEQHPLTWLGPNFATNAKSLSEAESLARLRELTPKGVPETVLPTLARYYLAHRQPDTDWVVLPVANLDAFFGTTSFSHTWLKELPEEVILRDRKRKDPCRYLVQEEFLCSS